MNTIVVIGVVLAALGIAVFLIQRSHSNVSAAVQNAASDLASTFHAVTSKQTQQIQRTAIAAVQSAASAPAPVVSDSQLAPVFVPAPAAPPVEPPPVVVPDKPPEKPPVVVSPPVAIPPPPATPLQPLSGDLLRDVLFLCAVSNGGPLTPAYQRAQSELGSNLNVYINAYKGQVGNYDFFKPMEHTGMLLYDWDYSRTPPNYVRAIGGMTQEQFDSIKPELAVLGYSVA